MPRSPYQVHTSCSVYSELKRWADENGVYLSTILNGALELLRRAGVAPRTKNHIVAMVALVGAALRLAGVELDYDTVQRLVEGRARLEARVAEGG